MSSALPPRVSISGGPFERGLQLGRQAEKQIRNSLAVYEQTFAHFTGLTWSEVRARAVAYQSAIEAYDDEIVPEMAGTAEGAGVDLRDILAINTRTEVMYGHGAEALAECTAFGARGEATTKHEVLLGQNWDWLPATAANCIVLEVEPRDRPAFVTFVEAGLLAKMGFNSAGIAMVTNLLLTDLDKGDPGVPFHVILRGILTSADFSEAVAAITRADRGSSANYLIAHADGDLVDVEARPGGSAAVHEIAPVRDVVVHANSFCGPIAPLRDRALDSLPDSPARTDRMAELLAGLHGHLTVESAGDAMRDHDGQPASICRHLDPALNPLEAIRTVGSVLIDVSESTMHLAFGVPCETSHEPIVPAFAARSQMAHM